MNKNGIFDEADDFEIIIDGVFYGRYIVDSTPPYYINLYKEYMKDGKVIKQTIERLLDEKRISKYQPDFSVTISNNSSTFDISDNKGKYKDES